MGDVIRFPGHKWYNCKCRRQGCMFCDGGLGMCVTCKGFEGTLPHHCPGVPMDEKVQNLVYRGEIDYIHGEGWTTKTWAQRMHVKGLLT